MSHGNNVPATPGDWNNDDWNEMLADNNDEQQNFCAESDLHWPSNNVGCAASAQAATFQRRDVTTGHPSETDQSSSVRRNVDWPNLNNANSNSSRPDDITPTGLAYCAESDLAWCQMGCYDGYGISGASQPPSTDANSNAPPVYTENTIQRSSSLSTAPSDVNSLQYGHQCNDEAIRFHAQPEQTSRDFQVTNAHDANVELSINIPGSAKAHISSEMDQSIGVCANKETSNDIPCQTNQLNERSTDAVISVTAKGPDPITNSAPVPQTASVRNPLSAEKTSREPSKHLSPPTAAVGGDQLPLSPAMVRDRRENLHKRYREAAEKSKQIFARLAAGADDSTSVKIGGGSAMATGLQQHTLTTNAVRRVPLILLPVDGSPAAGSGTATVADPGAQSRIGDQSGADRHLFSSPRLDELTFSSIAAESTPVLEPDRESPEGAENVASRGVKSQKAPPAVRRNRNDEVEEEESYSSLDMPRDQGRIRRKDRGYSDEDNLRPNNRENRRRDDRDDRRADVESDYDDAGGNAALQRRGGGSRRIRRSSSRASAYDGFYDERERRRDAERERYYGNDDDDDDGNSGAAGAAAAVVVDKRRRAGSRASERAPESRRQGGAERSKGGRSRSTRDYVYSDEEAEDSEELDEEDYEYAYRIHNYAYRGALRHRQRQINSYRMTLDPAWQKFLYEFYRVYGYHPTYEQLHQMWADQQEQSVARSTSLRPPSDGSCSNSKKMGAGATAQKGAAVGDSVAKVGAEMSRTEAYVASQQGRLYNAEKASQLSVTVSNLESDRSLEVLSSNVSATDAFSIQAPHKHSVAHAIARFGPGGQLITVCPKLGQNGTGATKSSLLCNTVQIGPMRRLVKTGRDVRLDGELEKMDAFPGPLEPNSTNKHSVVEFCRQKIHQCRSDMSVMDKDSAILLWNTLALLICQNGNVTGPDLSRLLMDGYCDDSDHVTESDTESVGGAYYQALCCDTKGAGQNLAQPGDSVSPLKHSSAQTSDNTFERRFRELLYSGSKKEALEWAMKHELWAHALFLAMKVDQRTYTNVMIRFADSLSPSDPLQTLYQAMSGVQPAAVTRLSDERWSDWRPHLAMILSNLSLFNGQPSDSVALQRELANVVTLGNTLMDEGRVFAAQFCYLSCHIVHNWNVFEPCPHSGRRFVTLLGAHSESGEANFLNIDQYQMTEIYEYAIGLAQFAYSKETVFLPSVRISKLKYAMLLLEYGNCEAAYKYLAILGYGILKNPENCTYMLNNLIVDLSLRLHKLDPNLHTVDFDQSAADLIVPKWIQDLKTISAISGPQNVLPESASDSGPHPLPPDQPNSSPANENRGSFYIGGEPGRQNSSPVEDSPKSAAVLQYSIAQPYPEPEPSTADPCRRNVNDQFTSVVREPLRNTAPEPLAGTVSEPISHSVRSAVLEPLRSNVPEPLAGTVTETFCRPAPEPYRNADVDESSVDPAAQRRTNYRLAGEPGSRGSMGYGTGATFADYQSPFTVSSTVTAPNPQATNRQSHASSLDDGVQQRLAAGLAPSNVDEFQNAIFLRHEAKILATNFNESSSNDSVFASSPMLAQSPNVSGAKNGPGQLSSKFDASKRNSSWLSATWGRVAKKILPNANEMILPDDKQKTISWDTKAGRWVSSEGDSNDAAPPPPPPVGSSSSPALSASMQSPQLQNGRYSGQCQAENSNWTTVGQENRPLVSPAQPAPKSASRLHGNAANRYRTVNAFNVVQNDASQPPAPNLFAFGAAPSAPTPKNQAYFVPQPIGEEFAPPTTDFLTPAAAGASSAPAAEFGAAAPTTAYAY